MILIVQIHMHRQIKVQCPDKTELLSQEVLVLSSIKLFVCIRVWEVMSFGSKDNINFGSSDGGIRAMTLHKH